jgi:threonine/homoserine/homoserine lactone efflux protein
MTADLLLAMLAFGFAMTATPGPNTLMLLASGVNFGFRPTLPHMVGIMFGLGTMLLAVGLGLGALLAAVPGLLTAMKLASIAYMLWLAWRIATAAGVGEGEAGGRPMTFLEGAAFQWVNVKAWMMIMGAISVYAPPGYGPLEKALYLSLVMLIAGAPAMHVWTLFGVGIRRFLQNPRALRAFNVTMALLLVASLIPMLR